MDRDATRRVAIGGGTALVVLLVASLVFWERCGLHGCPDVQQLKGFMPDEASVLLDRHGDEIGKLYVTRRINVPLDSVPETVPNAFIAIEDQRFWAHRGVDWRRVFGAAARNVRAGEIEEGSSTITMQLARNIFPDQLPASKITLRRKLAEAKTARAIERHYTKHEILELYINQIYFGSGAWGIEAAAQEYFGKPAADLTLAEASLLAALPRAPSRLNPRANPAGALEGRELVLRLMAEQGMISPAERAEAVATNVTLRKGETETGRAAYFVESVRRRLEPELGVALYTEGYRIHTTLDLAFQTAVEEELEQQLRAIESGRYGRYPHTTFAVVQADTAPDHANGVAYLQAAGVFMDTRTGEVLALVGGRSFSDSEYNRATQAMRQPGSAFKPFVYAAALGAGHSPAHQLLDAPLRYELGHGRVWEPRNYDGSYAGMITVRDALVRSKNVATVRLANAVGITRVAGTAERMGLGPMPTNPSMVLGTAEVTPLELTAAYGAFATLGSRVEPRFVTRVLDRHGRTVWSSTPSTRRVLDPAVAFVTTHMLEDVVRRGTGTAVRGVGYGAPAAGKTGTTQDAADVWFIGFTPDIVGGIWIGFDRRTTIIRGATGGSLAAPVWGRIMLRAGAGGEGWSPPGGVEERQVMSDGTVLAGGCPPFGELRREYFVVGTAPAGSCQPRSSLYAWGDTLGYYDPDVYGELRDDDDAWLDSLRARVWGHDEPLVREATPEEQAAAERAAEGARARAAQRDDTTRLPPADTTPRREATRQPAQDGPPPRLLGRPVDSPPRDSLPDDGG